MRDYVILDRYCQHGLWVVKIRYRDGTVILASGATPEAALAVALTWS